MKSFPFIVCLLIGLWVGYYLGVQKPDDAPAPVEPPRDAELKLMESFQEENAVLRERVAELEKQLAELQQQIDSSQP